MTSRSWVDFGTHCICVVLKCEFISVRRKWSWDWECYHSDSAWLVHLPFHDLCSSCLTASPSDVMRSASHFHQFHGLWQWLRLSDLETCGGCKKWCPRAPVSFHNSLLVSAFSYYQIMEPVAMMLEAGPAGRWRSEWQVSKLATTYEYMNDNE